MRRKVDIVIDTQYTFIIKYKDGSVKIQKKIKSEVNTKDGVIVVYEDGSSMKKYNRSGRPSGVGNKTKPPTQGQLDYYWMLNYNNKNECTICDNTGVIDTSTVNGRLNVCVCPIGREMIKKDLDFLKKYYDENFKKD